MKPLEAHAAPRTPQSNRHQIPGSPCTPILAITCICPGSEAAVHRRVHQGGHRDPAQDVWRGSSTRVPAAHLAVLPECCQTPGARGIPPAHQLIEGQYILVLGAHKGAELVR
eukprot:11223851-Lingulodinium_polyedra.AAC.1